MHVKLKRAGEDREKSNNEFQTAFFRGFREKKAAAADFVQGRSPLVHRHLQDLRHTRRQDKVWKSGRRHAPPEVAKKDWGRHPVLAPKRTPNVEP